MWLVANLLKNIRDLKDLFPNIELVILCFQASDNKYLTV